MAEKQIAWASGEGYITIIFGGDGNGSVSVSSDENVSYDAREQSVVIRTTTGSPEQTQTLLIKQEGKRLAAGTTFKFDYIGAVQSVDLPAGRYKLQCWGAQGGDVTGSFAVNGSKGGYSEGVLVLTEPKTLYVFVGGKGTDYTSSASQTSTTIINGGWNGGGSGVQTSRYNSGDTDGRSFPRSGGGATDIALVTSSMNYYNGRTSRSYESLLSRIIVAGGGAGASASYTKVTGWASYTTFEDSATQYDETLDMYYNGHALDTLSKGDYYFSTSDDYLIQIYEDTTVRAAGYGSLEYSFSSTKRFTLYINTPNEGDTYSVDVGKYTDSSSNSKSTGEQQGGGTSGKGQYPGTQSSSGGGGGDFGVGANQIAYSYRYSSGGGGAGWHGGGKAYSNTYNSYINYTGGGSGFVNTAANASYRPNGYTGLELESGQTIDGSQSFPSTDGSTETGHSGNGCAIITVL